MCSLKHASARACPGEQRRLGMIEPRRCPEAIMLAGTDEPLACVLPSLAARACGAAVRAAPPHHRLGDARIFADCDVGDFRRE